MRSIIIFVGFLSANSGFATEVKNGSKPSTPPGVVIPVANSDVLILQRAAKILSDKSKWNQKDNRECPKTASKYSLYCAMYKASVEINGEFDHRLGALEELRRTVETASKDKTYEHRMMDHNNDPTTSFVDIKKILAATEERLRERLAIKFEEVKFASGQLTLGGILYKPEGNGPFPTILYNHGSAPGMLNNMAAEKIGPLFVSRGWVFFMPYRRGQGLSAKAGLYIMDEIHAAERSGGDVEAAAKMIHLLKTDQLNDQLAALSWLKKQKFVRANQIAVAGNSFGGIQTVLGAEKAAYCAAVDASGGAQSWSQAVEMQKVMKEAVRNAKCPIFFFQAENDYDLAPSKVLSQEMKLAKKTYDVKFYPPFGKSAKDGHSFAYMGSSIWADDVFSYLQRHCTK
jgi:dienelactone hydrolase